MTTDTAQADSFIKGTLFCPTCGHSSGYDGDWTTIESGGRVHYLCPECRTEITTRSTSTEPSPRGPAALFARWTDSVRAWQSAWWESLLHS